MSDLIRRKDVIDALELRLENDYVDATEFLTFVKQLPSAEPERTAKVTDTWKIAGYDELNAWCPECEHRITRGCSYCPTCGVKLEWK